MNELHKLTPIEELNLITKAVEIMKVQLPGLVELTIFDVLIMFLSGKMRAELLDYHLRSPLYNSLFSIVETCRITHAHNLTLDQNDPNVPRRFLQVRESTTINPVFQKILVETFRWFVEEFASYTLKLPRNRPKCSNDSFILRHVDPMKFVQPQMMLTGPPKFKYEMLSRGRGRGGVKVCRN